MRATFDTETEKLSVVGQSGRASPRYWTIQIRVDGYTDVLTFKSQQKVMLSELSPLVEEYLRSQGLNDQRIRWTATAR